MRPTSNYALNLFERNTSLPNRSIGSKQISLTSSEYSSCASSTRVREHPLILTFWGTTMNLTFSLSSMSLNRCVKCIRSKIDF